MATRAPTTASSSAARRRGRTRWARSARLRDWGRKPRPAPGEGYPCALRQPVRAWTCRGAFCTSRSGHREVRAARTVSTASWLGSGLISRASGTRSEPTRRSRSRPRWFVPAHAQDGAGGVGVRLFEVLNSLPPSGGRVVLRVGRGDASWWRNCDFVMPAARRRPRRE